MSADQKNKTAVRVSLYAHVPKNHGYQKDQKTGAITAVVPHDHKQVEIEIKPLSTDYDKSRCQPGMWVDDPTGVGFLIIEMDNTMYEMRLANVMGAQDYLSIAKQCGPSNHVALNKSSQKLVETATPSNSTAAQVQSVMETLFCGVCGSRDPPHRCSRCKTRRYCSEQCQATDWPTHRRTCRVAETKTS